MSTQPGVPNVALAQRILSGIWMTKALYVAAKLDIADRLATEPKSAAELATETSVDADALGRVLRALASQGVFREEADGRYALNDEAAALRSGPGSLKAMAALWGEPWHWQAWGGFDHCVATGRDAFSHVFGCGLFEFFSRHPERAQQFDEAMPSFSELEARAIAGSFEFGRFGSIVDVGGGRGLLLAAIRAVAPEIGATLFELPPVIERLVQSGLPHDRGLKLAPGDMFEALPKGADLYILKNVLHDFGDEPCIRVLANCRKAMARGGRVLVAQDVIGGANLSGMGKLLDLQMLLIGGRERTEREYAALLERAGLRMIAVHATPGPLHLIEAGVADATVA
jgi:O-methyltransferase domain/Dimerisation domain